MPSIVMFPIIWASPSLAADGFLRIASRICADFLSVVLSVVVGVLFLAKMVTFKPLPMVANFGGLSPALRKRLITGYARTILFDFAKLMEVVRDGLVAKCREILVANLDFYTHAIEQLSRIEKFYMVGKDLDAGFVGLFLLQKLRLRRSIVVTDVNVLIKFYIKASVFHICRL